MSKLYHELADVYYEMYQSIFDYEEEYKTHKEIFLINNCKNILEVGCGTGNLASKFSADGFKYSGSDISKEMLTIARKNNPDGHFLQKDMRSLKIVSLYDAIFISGRSFTYMTTNEDVFKSLKSICQALKTKGIFVFDNFNANVVFGNFKSYMDSESTIGLKTFKRINRNSLNLKTGWTWDWQATYTIEEKGHDTKTIEDVSTLRAFTKDELKIFLEMSGFKVLKNQSNKFWIRTISMKK